MIKEKFIIGFLYLLSRMPWWMIHRIAIFIGYLLHQANGRERRNVEANLDIAFPTRNIHEKEALTRSTLLATALTYAELPKIWLRPETAKSQIDPNGVNEAIEALLKQNKGLIFAMPHLGNWEIISTAINMGHPSFRITGLYRPPRQAFLEPLLLQGRNKSNIEMAPTSRAGLKILNKTLKEGEVVAILPDQVPKSAGAAAVVAPFFNRPVLTMTLLNRMAARYQSPVLFLWAKRLPNKRYRMEYFVGNTNNAASDSTIAATALNQDIERCIADCPEQYQWAYRRFEPVDSNQNNPYT